MRPRWAVGSPEKNMALVRQQAGHAIGIARADCYQTTGTANAMSAAVTYRGAGPYPTHLHHLGPSEATLASSCFAAGVSVWERGLTQSPTPRRINAAFLLALQECHCLYLIRQNRSTVIQARQNIRMMFAQCSEAVLKALGLLQARVSFHSSA